MTAGKSFLALDVGNTRLKWAHYEAPRPGAPLLAQGAVFLERIDQLADTEWKSLPLPQSMLGCLVAGEAVRRRVEEQLELWDFDPHWVASSLHASGVINGYDHPGRLGPDRWTALIGAHHHIRANCAERPALVVMVGTAVTVDALDTAGRFIGGLIMPGFGLMLRALEMGTVGLRVPSGEAVDFPTNTSDALMTGGADAIVGAVERMRRKLVRHSTQEPLLLIGGGAATKLAPMIELEHQVVDTLVFEGLLVLQQQRLAC